MNFRKMYPFMMRASYFLLFVILFFYIIIVAKDFLIPVALSLLFSSLLFPVCRFLCKAGFPKILSITVAVLLLLTFMVGISVIFTKEINVLTNDFPKLKSQAISNVNELTYVIEENLGIETARQKNWLKEKVNNLFSSGNEFMNNMLNATVGTVFKILLLPVFVFYLLLYRERFEFFILRIVPGDEKERTNHILKEISYVSQRFFGGTFIVVIILSVINTLALYFIGIKFPVLFGVISGFCAFIPYFGTWIGAFFPFTFGLLTGETPDLAFWVLIYYAIIHFIENNILTPNITGGYVRLNPFITILGLIGGAMVWGIAGMLLVIPFMASLKIIFENFEGTKTLAYLIGKPENETTPKTGQTIVNFLRFKKKRTENSLNS